MSSEENYDLICIGGGIMSATFALMLKLLDSKANVLVLERLDELAAESTATLNNSGTGHSAFCELNYTPEQEDGAIDISKALKIFTQYERSKQFWSYLLEENIIDDPQKFIKNVPHHSWVRGEKQVEFLKKRFDEMTKHFPFQKMKFSEDLDEMKEWFSVIMRKRDKSEEMAATRMEAGTEVDFEALTKIYFKILKDQFNTPIKTGHEVKDLEKKNSKSWKVSVENKANEKITFSANRVFIGAGGGALSLLQKAEIEEHENYGGFPVSGQWLMCKNRDLVENFNAKVYTKAGVDAPPMAAPHLDTRHVDGRKELVFGPFAGFSTKFLKEGSYLDLPKSIEFDNLPAYWGAFWHNLDLTRYLVKQITMDHEDRVEALRDFVKDAQLDDWELKVAGQRVQIIKKDEEKGGDVEFGTDVVSNKDGSVTALLGASPGASVAVEIMIETLQTAFPEKMESKSWQNKLTEMIPFWKKEIHEDEAAFKKTHQHCVENLNMPASI